MYMNVLFYQNYFFISKISKFSASTIGLRSSKAAYAVLLRAGMGGGVEGSEGTETVTTLGRIDVGNLYPAARRDFNQACVRCRSLISM